MSGIMVFSVIMWTLIDRVKKLWEGVPWGKWLTTGLAVETGFLLAFGYNLDLLLAAGLTERITVGGQIFAGLALAAGSSCINELLEKMRGGVT